MSYARFSSESDVYVYEHVDGYLECARCALESSGESIRIVSRSKMLNHLEEHRRARHKVPASAFDVLQAEMEREGDHVGRGKGNTGEAVRVKFADHK